MQRGSLAMVSRKEAPGVWQFRWSEKDLHGVRVQRKRVIGSVERYPNEAADWIFASRRHRGRTPFWGQAILRRYIRPVAQRAGIQKRFGWHTFRHTYSTLLRSVGTEFKVMQELLRHSTLRSTLDVYTQALAPAKHAAQAAIFSLVFSDEANGTSQPSGPNDAAG
ncbi:MAG: site-specific integrase [Candidatus Acidiferrales bacterium]